MPGRAAGGLLHLMPGDGRKPRPGVPKNPSASRVPAAGEALLPSLVVILLVGGSGRCLPFHRRPIAHLLAPPPPIGCGKKTTQPRRKRRLTMVFNRRRPRRSPRGSRCDKITQYVEQYEGWRNCPRHARCDRRILHHRLRASVPRRGRSENLDQAFKRENGFEADISIRQVTGAGSARPSRSSVGAGQARPRAEARY